MYTAGVAGPLNSYMYTQWRRKMNFNLSREELNYVPANVSLHLIDL